MSLYEVHSSKKDLFRGRDMANQEEGFKSPVVTVICIFLSIHLRWWSGGGGMHKEISLCVEELEFAQLWEKIFSYLHQQL